MNMLHSIFFVIVSLLGSGFLFFLLYPKLQYLADRYQWTENAMFIISLSVAGIAGLLGQISENVSSDAFAKVFYFTFVFLWGFSLCVGAFLRER